MDHYARLLEAINRNPLARSQAPEPPSVPYVGGSLADRQEWQRYAVSLIQLADNLGVAA